MAGFLLGLPLLLLALLPLHLLRPHGAGGGGGAEGHKGKNAAEKILKNNCRGILRLYLDFVVPYVARCVSLAGIFLFFLLHKMYKVHKRRLISNVSVFSLPLRNKKMFCTFLHTTLASKKIVLSTDAESTTLPCKNLAYRY